MLASALIDAGVDLASLVFGIDGIPEPAAECASRGVDLLGFSSGASVVAILTNDRPSVEIALGAVVGGVRLVSLPLPARGADLSRYATFISDACAAFGGDRVVARDDLADMLDSVGVPALGHSRLTAGCLASASPGGFELVQYSSGSTSAPKAVAVTDAQLGANIGAILSAVRPRPGDCTVSWLPLSHDMGLVGMLLASVAAGSPSWVGRGNIVLLQPEHFLRSPGLWVGALSKWGGSFTAAPDFAYRMACAPRTAFESLDLSRLRCAIIGGDIVRADSLHAFSRTFADDGFSSLALCPAYGLAEVGLAASMVRPDVHWSSTFLNEAAFVNGRREPVEPGSGIEIVSSGFALDGYVVQSDGTPDQLAALRVSGPSIGSDGRSGKPFFDSAGVMTTGDVGFVDAGQVFPCGRGDDYMLVRGRNVFAPVIERMVNEVPGVRNGRVGVVAEVDGSWAVVVETACNALDSVERRALVRSIESVALMEAGARPTEVLIVAAGSLPLTSSGKLQRQVLRARWAQGLLNLV